MVDKARMGDNISLSRLLTIKRRLRDNLIYTYRVFGKTDLGTMSSWININETDVFELGEFQSTRYITRAGLGNFLNSIVIEVIADEDKFKSKLNELAELGFDIACKTNGSGSLIKAFKGQIVAITSNEELYREYIKKSYGIKMLEDGTPMSNKTRWFIINIVTKAKIKNYEAYKDFIGSLSTRLTNENKNAIVNNFFTSYPSLILKGVDVDSKIDSIVVNSNMPFVDMDLHRVKKVHICKYKYNTINCKLCPKVEIMFNKYIEQLTVGSDSLVPVDNKDSLVLDLRNYTELELSARENIRHPVTWVYKAIVVNNKTNLKIKDTFTDEILVVNEDTGLKLSYSDENSKNYKTYRAITKYGINVAIDSIDISDRLTH